jgi:uncharacterized OB-fold protein
MSSDLVAPRPEFVAFTAPFWQRAAVGELVLPRCEHCDTVVWFPRPFCPKCGSTQLSWFTASGDATLYSFTVVRAAPNPEYATAGAYVLAYATLAEGPTIMTNIVDVDPVHLEIGQPLRVTFSPVPEGDVALVRFRPA